MTSLLFKSLLLLFLLLNPPAFTTGRYSTSYVICMAAARFLEEKDPKYVNLKPMEGHGRQGFGGHGGVEACLPKGFRRSSAPSRYTNYQPLDTTCFPGKVESGH